MEAHQDCCMKFLDVHLTGPRNKQTQKQFLGDQNIFWRTNWLSQNCLSYCQVGLLRQLFLFSDFFGSHIHPSTKEKFSFPHFQNASSQCKFEICSNWLQRCNKEYFKESSSAKVMGFLLTLTKSLFYYIMATYTATTTIEVASVINLSEASGVCC